MLHTSFICCTAFLTIKGRIEAHRVTSFACTDRLARELLTQDRPLFFGLDGDGAAHYWDSYEFAVTVVAADGDAGKVELVATPFGTLPEWCGFTTRINHTQYLTKHRQVT